MADKSGDIMWYIANKLPAARSEQTPGLVPQLENAIGVSFPEIKVMICFACGNMMKPTHSRRKCPE